MSSLSDANNGELLLLDVRPEEDYTFYHARGSRNVPLYDYIDVQSGDLKAVTLLKAIAYAAQGVRGVERNENFDSDVLGTIAGGTVKSIVCCCSAGGTLKATQNFPYGQSSRSLIAAHRLVSTILDSNEEFKKITVYHMLGGLNRWFKDGGDGEGDGDEYDDTSGKVPFVPGYTIEQDSEELK